ncbi:mechanosensitive ion channel family protein [Bordetella bronchialis]|uniref:Small-conductance mechanosensitive channel n=1 Tax=Bordetella bronchialis TaxID=463025 RepID=A0A193FG55_9BORD|nr:mechanosensitive ion channel domain-containing protein [Bordetella bronchialis]ANN66089.1 mechanosensitive ion channel protein MscS [Bordetella bronchialis]ANN71175.1 mechanosensitive ion channel protein MscS [Bordetella bronchialis]
MQLDLNGFAAMIPTAVDIGLNLLWGVVILGLGWWAAGLLGRWVRRLAQRSDRIDRTIVPMFCTTVVWAVRIFTLIAVLAQFGVQTASIIAVLGAAGLAVGLALQGTLQNIAAGIMLLMLRPIRAGEYIALSSGSEGTVEEVGLFLTRLVQGDGIHVTLPNSTIWNATITNYSRNATRRFDMAVGIRYGDDLDLAIATLRETVNAHPLALQSPAPDVRVFEYRDNVVIVNVRVWAESARYWEFRWDLLHKARLALDAAGLRPPVPVREVTYASAGQDPALARKP